MFFQFWFTSVSLFTDSNRRHQQTLRCLSTALARPPFPEPYSTNTTCDIWKAFTRSSCHQNSASDVNHKGSTAQALSFIPPNCALSLKHHPLLQICTISAEKAMMTYASLYINSKIVWWQQPCINQHSIHTMGTLKREQKLHVSVEAHIHYGITASDTKLNWCLTRSTNKSQ